jgi:hypothetical protein
MTQDENRGKMRQMRELVAYDSTDPRTYISMKDLASLCYPDPS